MEIIPAPLSSNKDDLVARLSRMRGIAPLVQIDVTDGIYAGERIWPLNDPKSFEPIVAQDEGMPFWEDFEFEFDLMIANPAVEVPKFISAGASRIVVHLGALRNRADSKELVAKWRESVEIIAGISITDAVADIATVFGEVDGIQCMGIARIGHQHEPFDARAIDKVREARLMYPDLPIAVDGGVNDETAPLLIKAGATRLAVGSFLFSSGEEKERYDLMVEIAENASHAS